VLMANDSYKLTTWLDVRTRLGDSQQAKNLARRFRKAGAAHVMINEREVWSLWPADESSRAALDQIQTSQPGLKLHSRRYQASDPLTAWREPSAEPVGQGLNLAPAWMGLESGPETLVIEALTAFGGGDHASTRLNLQLICQVCQEDLPKDAWLADVGSGTGVLALALALKTGCRVVAVDPDPAAGRALTRNQKLNPLAASPVHFVRATHEVLAGPFALAAANLPEPILRVAAEHLATRMAPGGWLIASGFRGEAQEGLTAFLADLGYKLQISRQAEGWSGLAMQKVALK
jgi:ribosomal protein L11 methyltransferase